MLKKAFQHIPNKFIALKSGDPFKKKEKNLVIISIVAQFMAEDQEETTFPTGVLDQPWRLACDE